MPHWSERINFWQQEDGTLKSHPLQHTFPPGAVIKIAPNVCKRRSSSPDYRGLVLLEGDEPVVIPIHRAVSVFDRERVESMPDRQQYVRELREALGGRCFTCDGDFHSPFMHLDHITYDWYGREHERPESVQVLCAGCHFLKHPEHWESSQARFDIARFIALCADGYSRIELLYEALGQNRRAA